MTTYTVLILDRTSVRVNDLSPATTYLFRVQPISEGGAGGSSIEDEFKTMADGNTPSQPALSSARPPLPVRRHGYHNNNDVFILTILLLNCRVLTFELDLIVTGVQILM